MNHLKIYPIFLCLSLSCFSISSLGQEADITKAQVDQPLPKLLDLGAKKCLPCKRMAPILEELTQEYQGKFEVEFIDVWQAENKQKAQAYGIRAIPTQIFFNAEGEELWRHEGFLSKIDILKKWTALGFTFEALPKKQ